MTRSVADVQDVHRRELRSALVCWEAEFAPVCRYRDAAPAQPRTRSSRVRQTHLSRALARERLATEIADSRRESEPVRRQEHR